MYNKCKNVKISNTFRTIGKNKRGVQNIRRWSTSRPLQTECAYGDWIATATVA